jgi:hypothetical protein
MEILLLEQYLSEANIARINKTIKLTIDMESTIHSVERLSRHIDSRGMGDVIEESEIVELLELAIDDITKMLIFNEVDINDTIIVTDKINELNVAVVISGVKPNLKLVVRTTMRKKGFKPNVGQKQLFY